MRRFGPYGKLYFNGWRQNGSSAKSVYVAKWLASEGRKERRQPQQVEALPAGTINDIDKDLSAGDVQIAVDDEMVSLSTKLWLAQGPKFLQTSSVHRRSLSGPERG